ncbi:Alpha/Beta hydrolase protein [Dactylonectria estremocensis]|uniref:Alpha/Beta hydrolase protein n=1 Tax=Dactylonectria estremocensis TaxID=1079267 RepID=A0A9P9EL30_9HYPO|nr:Alpha/Beta hydrolase protein [Dactylonectria estremocensis]
MLPTLNDPDGLVNLQNLVDEVQRTLPEKREIPIVFVPGFSGWGAPLFGAINYFGGVIDIPRLLVDEGYTVIVAPVAPISTNWERACELYRQLTFGKFSQVNRETGFIDEVYDVDVDYGNYFDPDQAHAPEETTTTGRRRAILFTPSSGFNDWKWHRNKIHFVCHSQGGNTVRYLISLMAQGAADLHPTYFKEPERDSWTVSVTTLGTPHRGTTVIDVLEKIVSSSRNQALGLAARLFATASFYPPQKRAYDLQLDHWGVCRKSNETFQDMLERFESVNGPVWNWLESENNGLYDNKIEGVDRLSKRTLEVSEKVFYFSLSFHATNHFPNSWPGWGRDALSSFPTNIETFVRSATNKLPILGPLTSLFVNALSSLGWVGLMAITRFRSFVEWVTEAVITRLLKGMGYNLVLPNPGAYIPRQDVIPILLPFVYAMGSHELTATQKAILGPEPGDWNLNDGIVNTQSMTGPKDKTKSIASLPDLDFQRPEKKGVYWHLGVNNRMDHADEIGVFIEPNTGSLMKKMYLNIAKLIIRLPFEVSDLKK